MPFTPLPSLREIAARCGAARSTVGHILSGRDHLFKPETRDLVLRAAEEMGWKRPSDWRAVRRARFGCAVLLQSTFPDRSQISNDFRFALEDRLLDRNMHLTLARLPDDTLCSETALGRLLKQWSADGVLISYTNSVPQAMRHLAAKLKLPAVWLNSSEPVDAVRPDDEAAGAMAARLLLEAGHQRIAYCGYPFSDDLPDDQIHSSLRQRPRGARSAIEAAGATFTDHTLRGSSIAFWRDLLTQPDRPTAVICFNPVQVTPILHAALMNGMSVPADLSLITFHDGPVFLLEHLIASLDIPHDAIADRAVSHLCDRIAGEPSRAIDPVPFFVRSTDTIAPAPSSSSAARARPRKRVKADESTGGVD